MLFCSPICHPGLDPGSRIFFSVLIYGFRLFGRNDNSLTKKDSKTILFICHLEEIFAVVGISIASNCKYPSPPRRIRWGEQDDIK
jgi:hypothetical protein